jgi:hypothetical protein
MRRRSQRKSGYYKIQALKEGSSLYWNNESMSAITIPCQCCNGKGQKEICTEYAQTLEALGKFKRPASYAEIKARMIKDGLLVGTFDGTVIHKRVARLCSMGLVRKIGMRMPKKGEDGRRRAWLFERA